MWNVGMSVSLIILYTKRWDECKIHVDGTGYHWATCKWIIREHYSSCFWWSQFYSRDTELLTSRSIECRPREVRGFSGDWEREKKLFFREEKRKSRWTRPDRGLVFERRLIEVPKVATSFPSSVAPYFYVVDLLSAAICIGQNHVKSSQCTHTVYTGWYPFSAVEFPRL